MTSSNKIQLKWPNDIYWENSSKLGGLLVKSSILGKFFCYACSTDPLTKFRFEYGYMLWSRTEFVQSETVIWN